MRSVSPFPRSNMPLPHFHAHTRFGGDSPELQQIVVIPSSTPQDRPSQESSINGAEDSLKKISSDDKLCRTPGKSSDPKKRLPKVFSWDSFHLAKGEDSPSSLKHRMRREVHHISYITRSDDLYWLCSAIAAAASPWVLLNNTAKAVFFSAIGSTFVRVGYNYFRERKKAKPHVIDPGPSLHGGVPMDKQGKAVQTDLR